jgi:hypothetical protein
MKLASKIGGRRFRRIRIAAFDIGRQSASPGLASTVAMIGCTHPHAKQHAAFTAGAL